MIKRIQFEWRATAGSKYSVHPKLAAEQRCLDFLNNLKDGKLVQILEHEQLIDGVVAHLGHYAVYYKE